MYINYIKKILKNINKINKNIIEEGMQSIQLELGIGSVTVSFDKNLNIIMTQPKPTF